MICLTDINWTTGGRHRRDQTGVQVEASEDHGQQWWRRQSDQADTEQSPCCDTGDRLTMSPASGCYCPKTPEAVICTILTNSLERNYKLKTGLKFFIWLVSDPAFFSSGRTTAFLKSDRKQPTASELLNSNVTNGDSSAFVFLTSHVGTGSSWQLRTVSYDVADHMTTSFTQRSDLFTLRHNCRQECIALLSGGHRWQELIDRCAMMSGFWTVSSTSIDRYHHHHHHHHVYVIKDNSI